MIILPSNCESVADFPAPKYKVVEDKRRSIGLESEPKAEAKALQPDVVI